MQPTRLAFAAAALLLVAGCGAFAPLPPERSAVLPLDATPGSGDPTQGAVFHAADAFGRQGRFTGRPREAARALAELEFVTVDLANNPRFTGGEATVNSELELARAEARQAAGIAPGALPQTVIDGLFGAWRALGNGDTAGAERALTGPAFPAGGAATLAQLGALPRLPRAAQATSLAEREIERLGRNTSKRG